MRREECAAHGPCGSSKRRVIRESFQAFQETCSAREDTFGDAPPPILPEALSDPEAQGGKEAQQEPQDNAQDASLSAPAARADAKVTSIITSRWPSRAGSFSRSAVSSKIFPRGPCAWRDTNCPSRRGSCGGTGAVLARLRRAQPASANRYPHQAERHLMATAAGGTQDTQGMPACVPLCPNHRTKKCVIPCFMEVYGLLANWHVGGARVANLDRLLMLASRHTPPWAAYRAPLW